jgi:hypothetical protein
MGWAEEFKVVGAIVGIREGIKDALTRAAGGFWGSEGVFSGLIEERGDTTVDSKEGVPVPPRKGLLLTYSALTRL